VKRGYVLARAHPKRNQGDPEELSALSEKLKDAIRRMNESA
jgi:UDP-N-acetylglucosamine 2-epimerase